MVLWSWCFSDISELNVFRSYAAKYVQKGKTSVKLVYSYIFIKKIEIQVYTLIIVYCLL